MAPTPRRSKVVETPEKIQDGHEKFLQAFEKPTQIYRFLRSRHTISPIFLQRTLSYMKHTGGANVDLNVSKTNGTGPQTNRQNGGGNKKVKLKVDSILSTVTSRLSIQQQRKHETHMNLAFTGLFTKVSSRENSPRRTRSPNPPIQTAATTTTNNTVTVDVMLLKVCHKKRKDIISPVVEVPLGSVSIPLNPSVTDHGALMTITADQHTISIPRTSFSPFNGHTVKSYKLHLTVTMKSTTAPTNGRESGSHCKTDGSTTTRDPSPPAKRRRTSPMTTGPAVPHATVPSTTGGSATTPVATTYTTDLVVFDGANRCLLSDSFYELNLQKLIEHNNCLKQQASATWEVFLAGKNVSHFDHFCDQPILAFHLSWGKPAPIPTTPPLLSLTPSPAKSTVLSRRGSLTSSASDLSDSKKRAVSHRVFYQFIYSNTLRQITECREATLCPWCSQTVPDLYSLLKHLRLCHSRFTFTYVPHPKGARIDVTLNENFDGSYAGNPQDMCSNTGFHRDGTSHRTPVTNILVFRPRRVKPTLSEFTDNEHTDCDVTRQYMSGHNRLYYHSASTLPTRPKELDEDSEAEPDPDWLRDQTQRLIDEFTDVNTGEKDVMKMWNLHVMKHCYIADFQMPIACRTFVEEHTATLVSQGLTKNFILHLSNLYDFSLINDGVMEQTVSALQKATSAITQDQTPVSSPRSAFSTVPATADTVSVPAEEETASSCDTATTEVKNETERGDERTGLLQTVPVPEISS